MSARLASLIYTFPLLIHGLQLETDYYFCSSIRLSDFSHFSRSLSPELRPARTGRRAADLQSEREVR